MKKKDQTIRVTGLNYYPVKSFQGIAVDQIELDDFGFKNDRRYMLVDAQGQFVTQRKHPALSKFAARLIGQTNGLTDQVELQGPGVADECFGLDEFTESQSVKVWQDQVPAKLIPFERMTQFSEALGLPVSLAYMPDSAFRQVDRAFFAEDQRVNFADGFPILLTHQASLNELNQRLDQAVPMNRFRPNIVVEGGEPYAEDNWKQIQIGKVIFDCVKPCSRCVMTTIDEQAQKGKEPLATLATYRKNEFGVCFGENLVHRSTGTVRVGDKVEILA